MGERRQRAPAVVFSVLLVLSLPALGTTALGSTEDQTREHSIESPQVGLADGGMIEAGSVRKLSTEGSYISYFRAPNLGRVDDDGDGYHSNFDVSVTADTNLDTPSLRTTDPYFVVIVDGTEVLEQDVDTREATWPIDIPKSELEALSLDRGSVTIEVELRNTQIGDDPVYDSASTTVLYEPASEDISTRERGLVGIESLESSYSAAGDYLSQDYWQNRQIESVGKSFEALFPTVPEDRTEAQLEAAEMLLDEKVTGGIVGDLVTVPTVVSNVAVSLEEGKIANTLVKTSTSTRSNFHTSLDQLEQNNDRIASNPDNLDTTLENRLEIIEEVYEKSVTYESEVENSYTDNQEFFPDIIIWLYGADENSYETVQGYFDQLQQNLVADYYYTQLARYPNQAPEDLQSVANTESPTYPDAKITDVSMPDTVETGETVTVSMTVQTLNADTPSQTMTFGFPDEGRIEDVTLADHDHSNPQAATVFDSGSELWTQYGEEQQTLSYPVVEVAGEMSEGDTHTLEATFTPTESGDVRVWAKSIAWTDNEHGSLNPDPGWQDGDNAGVVRDGQNELAYEHVISVTDPDPAQYDVTVVDTNSPVEEGESLEVTADVENTGDVSGTQTVDLGVDGLSDSDSTRLSLDGGESSTAQFSVATGSGDTGTHTATVSSDDDKDSESVDVLAPGNFDVNIVETSSPIDEGGDIEVTAEIENTGDVSATQTIDLEVDGLSNSDSTSLSLDGGESRTEQLSVATSSGDAGIHTVTVSSDDDKDSESVDILELASFDVGIVETNSPVEEGEDLKVTAEVENTGDVSATQTVDLTVDGVSDSDSTSVSLDGGESRTEQFSIPTNSGDTGTHTATISSDDGRDSTSVTVSSEPEDAFFDVAIVDTNDPVEEGEALEVTAEIENTGDISGSQTVDLAVDGLSDSDSKRLSLDGSESSTVQFSVATGSGDTGTHTATVSSDDGRDSTSVTVSSEPTEAYFAVDILETNSPVAEGGDVEVTAKIENTGDVSGTQTVGLELDGLSNTDSTSLSLDGGESSTEQFSVATSSGDAGTYTATVSSDDGNSSEALTVSSEPDEAHFVVDTIETNSPVEKGKDLEVNATIENVGGTTDSQPVTLHIEGDPVETDTLRLEAGTNETLTLTWNTSENDVGNYNGTVSTDVDQTPLELSVMSVGAPPPIVGDSPPQDLTGDGLYEDLTGSGSLTVTDVQLLYHHRDSDAVQHHTDSFDFSDSGSVGVSDVQALYNQLTND